MPTPSDLPPGCSVRDIPGNRPEDDAADAFWDAFEDRCAAANVRVPEDMERQIEIARDLGLEEGFAQGRAEEQMARAAEEMDRAEGRAYAHAPRGSSVPRSCDICGQPADVVRPATAHRELTYYCAQDARNVLGHQDSYKTLENHRD